MRSQMRDEMRRNRRSGYRYYGGEHYLRQSGTYHDGYRHGYKHGWEDCDEDSEEDYRRGRSGRYM